LKRTAGARYVWRLLLLLRLTSILIIINRLATWMSGIPEQHPSTDWFLIVTDALEQSRLGLPYTADLRFFSRLYTVT